VKPIWGELQRRQEAKTDRLKDFSNDPLGFVKWAWRWGLPGPLERFTGPDVWQEDFLNDLGEQVRKRNFNGRDPVDPIKMTVSAGKGVGKGVLAGMLTTWIIQTWPYCQGTVTANTFPQLETKTWATIIHWFKTSRGAGAFIIGGSGIRHKDHGKSWMCTPQTCKEENSESFAGQHAANSVQFYIFDEASAIVPKIWEVADSGMVDGLPMFFAFGNPTRGNGTFYDINFGREKDLWDHRTIDARKCNIPNKKTIEEKVAQKGEDSDYVRVYIRGLPPTSSDFQYIDSERVFQAQRRKPTVMADEPLVAGVDCARGGSDKMVIRFRQGDDAQSRKAIKIPGEEVRDSMLAVTKLADLATQEIKDRDGKNGRKVDMWFVDSGSMGGPIVDRLKQLGHKNFIEINFANKCPDPLHYANMRIWMWAQMREHLGTRLAIDADTELEIDLTGPGIHHDKSDRIVLESKDDMEDRGLSSPDDADALCLSYAQKVTAVSVKDQQRKQWGKAPPVRPGEGSWML
jgi:hypothetical protein